MAYVKDEKSNLQNCVMAYNSIMSCGGLGMAKPFHSFLF